MFEKFKKRSHRQKTIAIKISEKPKKSQTTKESTVSQIRTHTEKTSQPIVKKLESKEETKNKEVPQKTQFSDKNQNKFMAIRTYSPFTKLEEIINNEISQSKSKLGECLLQIDKKRTIAEKSRKIRTAVYKLTEKNPSHEDQDEFTINGLEIILDATPRHEIEALENVVTNHQNRLQLLQQIKAEMREFEQLKDIQGINFLVVEKYGVPEKILLKVP